MANQALFLVLCCLTVGACGVGQERPGERTGRPETLSAHGLFLGDGSTQEPAPGVLPYDVNTPLFSDYTSKYRFVRLPPDEAAVYSAHGRFQMPRGTILVKTFAMARDLRDESRGRRLLETRLLVHEEEGWTALTYVWNEAQTEAVLEIAGRTLDVEWIHGDGEARTNRYLVPNTNQCKGCHRSGERTLTPIGLRARNLNRPLDYPEGEENQLAHWTRGGLLTGAPRDPREAPRLPVWDDETTGSLGERARAWLDINCAHCHNPQGPARSSGLDLSYDQRDPSRRGVYKRPVAAGRGSGGRLYAIVPGDPEASILLYRIRSLDPGVMMPELGKRLVHEEGVELIRRWIAEMPG